MSNLDYDIEKLIEYVLKDNIELENLNNSFIKRKNFYENVQLSKEYQELENKIFNTLQKNYKTVTKEDLEVEFELFLKNIKKANLNNTDMKMKIRNWKKEIEDKSKNKIVYYFPIFNLNSETPKIKISPNINLYSSQEIMNQVENRNNDDMDQIKRYLDQLDSVLGVEVDGYDDGNSISLNNATTLGRLFVSLVNFLTGIDGQKCVLVRDILFAEEKYNKFSGWMAVKKVDNIIKSEVDYKIYPGFTLPPYVKDYTFIFNPQDKKEKQIQNAIKWLGESIVDDNINSAYFKAMIALESVAEMNPDKISAPSITNQVSTMTALIIEEDKEKRLQIKRKLVEAYRKRSDLVHGESIEIDYSTYYFMINVVDKLIRKIVSRYSTCSDLSEVWANLTHKMLSIKI